MVDHRTRCRGAVAKVPRDESATVVGRKEEFVEYVLNQDLFVVVTLINFHENEEVGALKGVNRSDKRIVFRRRKKRKIRTGEHGSCSQTGDKDPNQGDGENTRSWQVCRVITDH